MNILIVNPMLYTTENYVIPAVSTIKETMIYGMCLGFLLNGHRVTLAASAEYKPTVEETYDFEVIFFKSTLTRFFPPGALPFSLDFYRFVKAHHRQFDLIVSGEVFSFMSLFTAIRCPDKTVIWQEMAIHQRKFKRLPSKFWHRIIIPLFFRRVKVVIPRSEKARLFIGKYLSNVSSDYVDHGINVANFEYAKEKKKQFVSSSRLVYRKNIESIIAIVGRLVRIKGYEDYQLLIAGDGDRRQFLEEEVDRLHLRGHVFFLGFLNQKQLNNCIKSSCAFLINTLWDNNLLSIPEAIVSGTPVMTNLQPNMAEYVTKHQVGIAKDNWDEYDLVKIIDNNAMYIDNCLKSRDQLSNLYSAGQIVEIFNDFCDHQPSRKIK